MVKRIVFIACLSFAFYGCNSPVIRTAPVEKIMNPPLYTGTQSGSYRIGVGDDIEVKFFFSPELNDRMTVRPDGKISLMFVQDIRAAGRTADELSRVIKHKLASHVKQLDMVVIVRSFNSRKAYVGGEVSKPGSLQLSAREDLLQAIDDAGWITPAASRKIVLLIRRDQEGNDAIYPINYGKIMSGEDMSQNLMLEPGDLVLVPPSDSTSMDRWIDQNIRQVIPITTGILYNGR